MSEEKIKKILCQQMELIAEVSKNAGPKELANLSDSMSTLCLTYQQINSY